MCLSLCSSLLVQVAVVCSLNMYLNSEIPITSKPLIQYNTSRRWVLKIKAVMF